MILLDGRDSRSVSTAGLLDSFFFTVLSDWVKVLNVSDYLALAAVIIPIYIILFAIFGLYKPIRTRRFYREGEMIFIADTVGILITVCWLYLTRNIYFSRLMLAIFMYLRSYSSVWNVT